MHNKNLGPNSQNTIKLDGSYQPRVIQRVVPRAGRPQQISEISAMAPKPAHHKTPVITSLGSQGFIAPSEQLHLPVAIKKQIDKEAPKLKPTARVATHPKQAASHSAYRGYNPRLAHASSAAGRSMPISNLAMPQPQSIQFNLPQPTQIFTKGYLAFGAVAVLLVMGLAVNVKALVNNRQIQSQTASVLPSPAAVATTQVQAGSIGDPTNSINYNEANPSYALSQYAVAPGNPRVISIAKVGVTARVMPVAALASGELMVPKSIYDTGWYNASAKPGQPGAVVIVGHVSGPTRAGVFYSVDKLVTGDIITIEKGDGTKIGYQVVSKEVISAAQVDMKKVLKTADPQKQGLNIMVNTGKDKNDINTYDKRLIIYATQT